MSYVWDVSNPSSYNNKMGKYKYQIEFDFILKYLTKECNILDVGGGSGRFAIPIHNLGYDITVLEKSEEALDILHKKNSQIKTINNDFMEYNLDQKYDLIIAIEVITYINDWTLFFEKINSNLNTGGRFIFTTANPKSWRFLMRKLYNKFKDYSYYNYHTIDDIKQIIGNRTLTLEEVKGFYWLPFKLNSNNFSIDFFITIERLLGLKYFISQSPWLIISLKKTT
jgi:2-polyprenyl-3-methyl-5-hydroxy-6-metoxy-1,4-benzoquinol methylase